MPRTQIDTSVTRHERHGFAFPLGAYPVEPFEPRPGYVVAFESADGGEGDDWEEWPDRYAFDIVISAQRVEPLCRALFALLPARVYPILDVLGADAYREVDPYIAYDLVGFDRFVEQVHAHRDWLYEDGLVGFGAMSVEPFVYIFVDEHKIVTVRVETDLRERVERILAAFDVPLREEPLGVDAAAHEHRAILYAPPDRPDLLTAEEIRERLLDVWRLQLNVDHDQNLDDDGRDVGVTPFRCLVRVGGPAEQRAYAEVFLAASCLADALWEAAEAGVDRWSDRSSAGDSDARAGQDAPTPREDLETTVIVADRVRPDEYPDLLRSLDLLAPSQAPPDPQTPALHALRWLED